MTGVVGFVAVLFCAVAGAAHAADSFMLSHDLCDRPRSARAVLDEPAVKQALRQHLVQTGSRLVIHHGLGQESSLQAAELRLWLMALAIDGARISLGTDVKHNEPLRIEVK